MLALSVVIHQLPAFNLQPFIPLTSLQNQPPFQKINNKIIIKNKNNNYSLNTIATMITKPLLQRRRRHWRWQWYWHRLSINHIRGLDEFARVEWYHPQNKKHIILHQVQIEHNEWGQNDPCALLEEN